MDCRRCGSSLVRPGDYCLVCHTINTDTVVLELDRDRSTVYSILDDGIVGERVVTTIPHKEDRKRRMELRNYAGLISDEVRRKRATDVFGKGDMEVLREVRSQLHHSVQHFTGEIESLYGDEAGALDVVEASPEDKIGGKHTTFIGEKRGRRAVEAVARHPNVKKIIPGPIDAGGRSGGGFSAKATRADSNGNLRLLVRRGSSVQENRVVTTAVDRKTGERVRDEVNEDLGSI